MVRGIPAKTGSPVIEMITSKRGKDTNRHPAGAIAQAWLTRYSRQPTWDDLKTWLRDCSRL
jgi:hypothetical protein